MPSLNSVPPAIPHAPWQSERSQSRSRFSETKAPFHGSQGRAAKGSLWDLGHTADTRRLWESLWRTPFERLPIQPSAWYLVHSWCPKGAQLFPEEDPLRLGCVRSLEELGSASGQQHRPSVTLKSINEHINAVTA